MASTLAGAAIRWARLTIPKTGVAHLECEVSTEGPLPTGTVPLVIDDASYLVTVTSGGDFVGKQRISAVGGHGGWKKTIPSKGYASPVGIAAATLITDAARECGEVPGLLPTDILGGHYARREGAASRVLSDTSPGAWWVDAVGLTQTGARSALPITDPELTVLDFDAGDGELTLGVGDLAQYTPGRQLTSSMLPASPVTLDLLTVIVVDNEVRVQAWIA